VNTGSASALPSLLNRLTLWLLVVATLITGAVYFFLHQISTQAELQVAGVDVILNAAIDQQILCVIALLGLLIELTLIGVHRLVVAPLTALAEVTAATDFAGRSLTSSGIVVREIGVLAESLVAATAARKASELAQKEQLERFELATRGAAEVIWDIDLANGHATFSPRLAELLDLPDGDLPQLTSVFEALIHPADFAGYRAVALAHLRDRAPYHCEFRLRRANGEYCWVMSRGQALWNPEGRATRVAGSLTDMTEQHVLQTRTQAVNAKMTEIIANTPAIIFEFLQAPDGQGYFESTSPLLHELLGLDPAPGFQKVEILLRVVATEDLPALLASIDCATREASPWLHEFRCRLNDGRVIWLEGRSQPRLLADKSVKFTGALVDITARKTAEQAQRDGEHRLQLVVQGGDLGTWEWDYANGMMYVNPRWCELHGLWPQALCSVDAAWTTVHPEDKARIENALAAHLQGGAQFYDVEFRVKRADDTWGWVHDRGQVVTLDQAGQPLVLAGTHTDITERKRSAERLRDAQVLLRSVLDLLPQRVFWKDRNGYYLGSNKAFADDHGKYSVAGLSARELTYTPQEWQRFEETDHRVMTDEVSERDQLISYRNHDGNLEWISFSLMPLRNAAREIIGVLGTYLDVTQFKETEQALIAARDAADLATRAKSDFLATMSHEIRTPLNGVLGCTEILLTTQLTPDQRSLAETVAQRGKSLLALLNDVLDLSKLEAGGRTLERMVIGPRDLCAEVVELFAPQACEKHLELTFHWDPLAPAVIESDATCIRHILTNLLGNALKFTAEGGVIVAASVTAEGALRIAVEDTGIGITTEHHSVIFSKFTQADSSITRHFGGTGLGLAISQQLVQALGGEIGLTSSPGAGSTFWFTVPRGTDLDVTETPPSALAEHAALVLSAHAPRRASLVSELQSLGLNVWAVDSLAAARAVLATQEQPLVLFDYAWPDCDSATLAAALRATCPGARLIPLCTVREIATLDRSQFCASLQSPVTRRGILIEALLQALEGVEDAATVEAVASSL
jgi:PAS domain S-box-containing protein